MVVFKSILIGLFAIFPGVSGSALAISFNLYDRVFLSFRNLKENKLFLAKIIIGILIGLFIGSKILIFAFNYKTIIYYLFIGIILSEIPSIIKKIKGKIMFFPFIISFVLSVTMNLINNNFFGNSSSSIKFFIGGILFSLGKIFPGLSSSFFLISLGIYEDILLVLSNPYLLIIKVAYYFPFIIGIIFGVIIFIKLLEYLINNKYALLYNVILGFILSTIIIIFPKFNLNIENILGIILMLSIFVIIILIKYKKLCKLNKTIDK